MIIKISIDKKAYDISADIPVKINAKIRENIHIYLEHKDAKVNTFKFFSYKKQHLLSIIYKISCNFLD
ncbi:hypothetical protein [Proteiniborus sp. DW1]|uniref:hypothetical protein n=1 Tax=Proteiniborus sp. DW1 TaxID=1889883 RepID=UPI000A893D67|nr:hypothetical protein [Proteiniborus sp. DW1]